MRNATQGWMSELATANPWGAVVFIGISLTLLIARLAGVSIGLTEALGILATAGGLLGVGHSFHRANASNRAGRRPEPLTPEL